MKSITINTFRSEIKDWLDMRFSKLPDFSLPFFSQGGWEGWLQVEWAMFFTMRDYDVMREFHAYDQKNFRADLVFNNNILNHPNIVIEIKCQSIYVNYQSFYNSILNDEHKLSLLSDGQRCAMFVVVVEPSLFTQLKHAGYNELPIVQNNIRIMYRVIK